MANVTYYLGAGASANALPLVKNIPERLQAVIDLISAEDNALDHTEFPDLALPNIKSRREYQKELIESLKWLNEKSAKHASIDTFAKKLYLSNHNQSAYELKKLKICLSIYFILEQSIKVVDNRYDTFFASILQARHYFPPHIRVLSWNYDYQFELAYSDYSDDVRFSANQDHLRILKKHSRRVVRDHFCITKLNGTTEFHESSLNGKNYILSEALNSPKKELIETLVKQFALANYNPRIESSLSFAWESDSQEPNIIEKAIKVSSETEVLVVIGYSFPFFNREVDKAIIQSMTKLKKVYFQSPDAHSIIERFQAIREGFDLANLIPRFDLEQFYLPDEL